MPAAYVKVAKTRLSQPLRQARILAITVMALLPTIQLGLSGSAAALGKVGMVVIAPARPQPSFGRMP